ncbi:MAG: transporter substrate-binding domain-containing protein [Acetobacteraceae bacterium]|nr:transporter substrate-binding domain-containing protein [Acetobacteraceae bacterium]
MKTTLALICALSLAAWSTSAPAQSTLEKIKKTGVANVATEVAYPPFEFRQEGKIVGYDEDILLRVVDGLGVKLEQQDVPFAGILAGLLEKKYDFVATALIINPERSSKYAFTMPVAVAKVGIMKRAGDSKIRSVDDLTGAVIGSPVPPAGPTTAFQHYNDELKPKGKNAARNVFFQSSPDMDLALANGQVDGVADSMLVIAQVMKQQPGKFEVVGTFGEPNYIGWVTRPEDTQLRDAINEQIRKLRDDGELTRLQQKWFGLTMDIPVSGYLPPGSK